MDSSKISENNFYGIKNKANLASGMVTHQSKDDILRGLPEVSVK
jgi:hypothetical protein